MKKTINRFYGTSGILLMAACLFSGCSPDMNELSGLNMDEFAPYMKNRTTATVLMKLGQNSLRQQSKIKTQFYQIHMSGEYKVFCYLNVEGTLMCILYENGIKVSDFSLKLGENFSLGDVEVTLSNLEKWPH